MDTEHVISWFVGVAAALGVASQVRAAGLRHPARLLPNAGVLGVLAAGSFLSLPGTAFVALGLWLVLVLTPVLLLRRAARLMVAERLGEAARVLSVAGWLAPWEPHREGAELLRAQSRAERGDLSGAREALGALVGSHRFGELAAVERMRLDDDWPGVVAHIDGQPVGTRDIRLLPIYLRALGETGDVERLLVHFARSPEPFRAAASIQILVAAFAGRPDWVRRIAEGPLSQVPERSIAYWHAMASQAAADPDSAAVRLRALAQETGTVGRAARRRLAEPLAPVAIRSEAAQEALEALGRRIGWQETLAASAAPRRPLVTYALMAVLAVVFAAGLPGGSTDVANLVSMGALVLPIEAVGGALWWRVIAAGFLHFGPLHLLMNLLGLWIVGSNLERIWNGRRVLLVFLVANIGAFALVAHLQTAARSAPEVLLGASAGVMGLVGALTAFTAVGFFYGKNRLLLGQLQLIGIVLVAQVAFDLSTPMVASSLHVAGFFCGGLSAMPFAAAHWRRRRAAAPVP